jgi:hypothetical protein
MKLSIKILHRDWKTGVPTVFEDEYNLSKELSLTELEKVVEMESWLNSRTDARFHFFVIPGE